MRWLKLLLILGALVGLSLQADVSPTEPDFIDADGEVIEEVMLSEAVGQGSDDQEAEDEADLEIEVAEAEDEEAGNRVRRAPLVNRFPGTPPSKEEQLEEELEEIENDVAELTEDEDQASVEEAKEKLEKASADVLETIQDLRSDELNNARTIYYSIIGAVVGVILIVMVILICCIHKRRKAAKKLSEEQQPLDGATGNSRRSSRRSIREYP